MYLHIKKEAFCINNEKVLSLVACSVVFVIKYYLEIDICSAKKLDFKIK